MLDIDKVDTLASPLLALKQEGGTENYWNNVAETIAQALGFYFIGIYFSDTNNEYMVFNGGSGEAGKTFLKIGYKCKIINGKQPSWHAGTAAYLKAILLINWAKGEISSFEIAGDKVINRKLLSEIRMFWSPQLPLTQGELFIPIRLGQKTIGILEVNLDVEPQFTEEEMIKLSTLANYIASIIK